MCRFAVVLMVFCFALPVVALAQAQAAGLRPAVDHFSEIDQAHRGYVTFNEVAAWRLDDMAKHMPERAAQLRGLN